MAYANARIISVEHVGVVVGGEEPGLEVFLGGKLAEGYVLGRVAKSWVNFEGEAVVLAGSHGIVRASLADMREEPPYPTRSSCGG